MSEESTATETSGLGEEMRRDADDEVGSQQYIHLLLSYVAPSLLCLISVVIDDVSIPSHLCH